MSIIRSKIEKYNDQGTENCLSNRILKNGSEIY